MIDYDNTTDFPYEPALLDAIASALTPESVETILVDDETIRELNLEHRGLDKPTDVLSFPLEPFPGAPLGSIIISVDTARRQAEEMGHPIESEIAVLFLHGLLHLKGFDHECDQGEMAAEESRLRRQFNLPLGLTER
ncbi:MAG: rRNA maturation RNase YbeY [Campylobacterales bacterium]